MNRPEWITSSPLYDAAFDLHEDAGGNMSKATSLANRLLQAGGREDVVSAGLLHNIAERGEIFLVSSDHLFGPGIANILIAAAGDLSDHYPNRYERLRASDWRPKAVLVAELLEERPDDYLEQIQAISPYNKTALLNNLVGSRL